MSINALVERAMILSLGIGIWQGQRHDRDASAKVTSDAGAAGDAARVNKHLVPKEALKGIVTAQNAIRSHFYAKTMPWRDNGDRLMPRKMFTSFIEEHEKLVADFQAKVNEFLGEAYPAAIAQAEFRMGTMFNRDDYPPASSLYRRFYAELDYGPVTTAGDFRVELDSEHADKVKSAIEAAAEARMATAMGDVWKRMAETVSYFQTRMADPKAVFRDSTVENIDDLLALIPGLNVLDDPDIEKVREMISSSLGGLDPAAIRKDGAQRSQLAGEAAKIVSVMDGFMKAFGNGAA